MTSVGPYVTPVVVCARASVNERMGVLYAR